LYLHCSNYLTCSVDLSKYIEVCLKIIDNVEEGIKVKDRKRKYNAKFYLRIFMVLLILAVSSFYGYLDKLDPGSTYVEDNESSAIPDQTAPIAGQTMEVHFIDVGQGDSILIKLPSQENMLIDAGDNGKEGVVIDYLKDQGVSRIDHLIATHPHADHIGGMDYVIDEFDIGHIYMPKVVHTTKTYMDVLEAIERKNLEIKSAKAGMTIPLEGVTAEILAPDGQLESDNLNDYSIVIRLSYGQTIFLFQGDAEKLTEDYILESHPNIKADVLKLGHHGSSTSNTPQYIEAVDPDYGIITAGEGNKYGHPHKEIMELMNEKGITIYRTDKDGSIVVISDGKEVSFDN